MSHIIIYNNLSHSGAEITNAGQVQMASHGPRKLEKLDMMMTIIMSEFSLYVYIGISCVTM